MQKFSTPGEKKGHDGPDSVLEAVPKKLIDGGGGDKKKKKADSKKTVEIPEIKPKIARNENSAESGLVGIKYLGSRAKVGFEGKEGESRIAKISLPYGEEGIVFFARISGKEEDYSENPQKFLDMMSAYAKSSQGSESIVDLFEQSAMRLYRKFGVEGSFEITSHTRELLVERANSIEYESTRLLRYGKAGLSNYANEAIEFAYANISAMGGVTIGVASMILLTGPIGVAGFSVGAALGIAAAWLIGKAVGKTRKLEIDDIGSVPHETFHALSDNDNDNNGYNPRDRSLEEGLTSELTNDWAYKDERSKIREYLMGLGKEERKEALDLLMKEYLNLELSGREKSKVDGILWEMFPQKED